MKRVILTLDDPWTDEDDPEHWCEPEDAAEIRASAEAKRKILEECC